MRIISGKFKGHSLFCPKDHRFRPTQDRVKEAIFSVIQSHIPGAKVLDLYCGTGSLGLEALSRGAASCAFADLDLTYLKRNIEKLYNVSRPEDIRLFRGKVLSFLKQINDKFDLIFIDPPYDLKTEYEGALKLIFEFELQSRGGIIVCEHKRGDVMPQFSPIQREFKEYTYGTTGVTIIK